MALSIVALAAAMAYAGMAQQYGLKEISTEELKKRLDAGENIVLVDARRKQDYARGHLPGAINVSPNMRQFIAGYLPRDRNLPLVFYCKGFG